MAEGVFEQEKGSLLPIGSEFVYDFYCELCRDDSIHVEAEGFCVDCEEYLCNTCIHAHRKSRPTRHHDVQDRDNMPKDIPLTNDRISKDISTKCNCHSGKTVEFYCESHDTLGCSTCFVTSHKPCRDIESIYDKSESILDSLEYKNMIRGLTDMQRRSRAMIFKARDNVTTIKLNCSNVVDQLRKFKEEFIAHFEELEHDLISEVETLTSEEKEKMEHLEKELNTFTKEADQLKQDVEALVNSKRVCQLYVHIKTKKSELSTLEGNLRKVEEENHARTFKFKPSSEIGHVLTATSLGTIDVQDRQSFEAGTAAVSEECLDISNITAEHVSDIDISYASDSDTYYFLIGSAVMVDTKVVIADFYNKSVKLLDTQTHKLISEVGVLDCPFDIAMVNENNVAVSLYNYKKIIILNITDTVKVDHEIVVQGECRGVSYNRNKLFVTFCDTPRIEVMDIQGNVITTIDKNTDGSDLFYNPRHICVSKSGENVYVSDTGAGKVVCLTLNGVVKSVYSGLGDPQKVCTDHRGYVYVAGSDSQTVHMLSADCIKITEILTQVDGLDMRVLSVSHCQCTDRLYVGMLGSTSIKVYQLNIT